MEKHGGFAKISGKMEERTGQVFFGKRYNGHTNRIRLRAGIIRDAIKGIWNKHMNRGGVFGKMKTIKSNLHKEMQ